jgi:hypothetical protein
LLEEQSTDLQNTDTPELLISEYCVTPNHNSCFGVPWKLFGRAPMNILDIHALFSAETFFRIELHSYILKHRLEQRTV